MKIWSLPVLGSAALLSAALVAPFHSEWTEPDKPYVLATQLASSAAGRVQVYYDRGHGFREADSSSGELAASAEPKWYRLRIPAGTYRQIRFDPIDRDGTVTIAAAHILDSAGHSVQEIPLSDFSALNQIQSLRLTGSGLQVIVVPGSNDPQLLLRPLQAIRLLPSSPWARVILPWMMPVLGVWAALVLTLAAFGRSPGWTQRGRAAGRWLSDRPQAAIAIAAAAAALGSCYPVVLLHRSFVSPNIGTLLLYDEMPTLPGSSDRSVVDPKGVDAGAIMWQQVPQSAIEHRSLLRDGELPWWNRYDSAGTPLIGQGQAMFGDPLHLLVIAAGSAAWAWDAKYLAAKWLLAWGLGLCVWTLRRHGPAAWITAAAAPFLGFFWFRLNHPAFFSFCYAPWPLVCWLRLSEPGSVRAAVRWSVGLILANAALLCSGTVKEAYLLLLTMNLAGAAALLADRSTWRQRRRAFFAIAAGAVLFAALTAPVWFSFLDTLRQAYTSYDTPAAFQIQPGLMLAAFDEALYRPLTQGNLVFDPSANFLVLGGVLYFLATLRAQFTDRRAMGLAAAALVPLGFAFGFVPPAWIVQWPFLGQVTHIDNTFSCGLILLWVVLAGVGFATAARRLGTAEGRADLGIAGLLLFALVFAYVGFGQAAHRSVHGSGTTFSVWPAGESLPLTAPLGVYLALLLAALVTLGLLARRALARRQCGPAAVLLAVLCAYVLLWRNAQQPAGAGYSDYLFRPGGRVSFAGRSDALRRVQESARLTPVRSIGLQNNFFPGWTAMYGLEGVSGPDALIDRRFRELTGLAPIERVWDWRLYLSRDTLAAARPFLDFLNVRYYFDLRSDQTALGAVLRLVQTGDLDVYESPTVWPRAFFTDRLARYDQAGELMDQILHGDGRPFAAILRHDLPVAAPLGALLPDLPNRMVVPATAYHLTENSTAFTLATPGAGLAVLGETGWAGYAHAEVDGKTAAAFRVNHAFIGLFLPTPGTHRIVVSYRPRHSPWLVSLSAATALALAAGFVAAGRRVPGWSPAAKPV